MKIRLPPAQEQFAAGMAALVTKTTGVDVEQVVEIRTIRRCYADRVVGGRWVKTGCEEVTTEQTIWEKRR